jgi:hypothetical protein
VGRGAEFCEWGRMRNKGRKWRWDNKPTSQSRGIWQIMKIISWDCGWCTKLNYSTLLREELTSQSCSYGVTQLPPGKKKQQI